MTSDDELLVDEKENSEISTKKKFDIEGFIHKNRVPLAVFLFGTFLIGLGSFFFKKGYLGSSSKIEVLETTTESQEEVRIVVEIVGAVENPGVYELSTGDRVNDLLAAAGGLSFDADRDWVTKMINKAAKLSDGQKFYIPLVGEQSDGMSANFLDETNTVLGDQGSDQRKYVNINTATQSELEALWGIGPVYAQNIIEHRPYSSVEELLKKKILKENVYERNKEFFVVY